jgi:hypothetical protein
MSYGKMASMLAACAVALLPIVTFANSSKDILPNKELSPVTRVLTSEERILEQEKSSVCGTGQIYAGTVIIRSS